ncbi:MAG: tyrosine-type recombinase/integrase [Lachnospiraceae bacterium]|nr:tyrosine-type recombinase/integrase [Lachnospiraceae bacterium]
MNYVEPIRDAGTVQDIADYLKTVHEKYYVMYEIGIYSGLRVSDILKLKIRDIRGKDCIRVREKKTRKEKLFPVNRELRPVLDQYCEGKPDYLYVVPSARATDKAVSREYAYRVIHEAGEAFGLDNLGTHTMRKTFGYHFYLQTKDIVLLMRILNHSDEKKTLRYIGIEQSTINDAMRRFSYKSGTSTHKKSM